MLRHVALAALIGLSLVGCGPSEPKSSGGPAMLRRLTQEQYQNIIADVFGRGIVVGGRFDPLVRQNGLLAVGAGNTAMTVTALDGYDGLARTVAKQVVDEQHRSWLVPCKPASLNGSDDACARAFFAKTGRLLYRRALSKEEVDSQVAIAADATKTLGSFYDGLAASLTAMLVAPEFLYIQDTVDSAGRLSANAKAARLSFFLWDSGPDDALLDAAEKGELDKSSGLKREVDRLLASPRLEQGARAFFADMYGFDGFETLQKDSLIYPAFGLATAEDAKEQTLRTIIDLVVTKNGDYRDLFTTRTTFVSGALGMIYHVSVKDPEGWEAYTFPEGDQHVGIQSHAAFQSLFSHPGRSSATIRGKAIRELFMCQKVPDPPANVDFTLVSDVHNAEFKTARERLSAHAKDPSCSGCHRLVDPIGLALENFDGAGQWRTQENGASIDPSGEVDGIKYTDPAGLGKALHDSPAISSCVVNRLASYAFGRPIASGEKAWVDFLDKSFVSDGYKLRSLMRRIALADAFYALTPDTAKAQNAAAN